MNEYRYLIGYAFNHGTELARTWVSRPVPITTEQDVEVLQACLRGATNRPDALVLSFSPLVGGAAR